MFVPLITDRGQRNPRLDRCERVIIEACKQCGRAQRMLLSRPMSVADALEARAQDQWLTLDPYQDHRSSALDAPCPLTLAMGPGRRLLVIKSSPPCSSRGLC